jgi:alpha-acetolactate decarboxylase
MRLFDARVVLVQHLRPVVADLVGAGRMGLGTLLAPADPMVVIDGLCYRLDAGMSASRVSPLERVRFGRADGTAVGFVTCTASGPDWHLSFLTNDRTFGGPILEISIENVELRLVAPRVVGQATAVGPVAFGLAAAPERMVEEER